METPRSILYEAVSYKNKPLTKNHTKKREAGELVRYTCPQRAAASKKCEEGELVRIEGGIGGSTAPITFSTKTASNRKLSEAARATP